jgi:hypothetical protein
MKIGCICALAVILTACTQKKPEAAPITYYKVDPATAGKVRGAVRFQGKKPSAKPISMDAEEACEKLHADPVDGSGFVVGKDGAFQNVFVYIKSGLEGKAFEPPKQAVILDQRGCMFVPRVIALRAGQTLTVKNSDPVSHNIHPNPQNNREWNQQQSPGAPDLVRRFVRPEVMIPVKCNIHNWMRSYIGVVEHPYFGVTDASGAFDWKDIPPGEYVVAAWHEGLPELTQKVILGANREAILNFTFQ